jgi:nitrosocyanin
MNCLKPASLIAAVAVFVFVVPGVYAQHHMDGEHMMGEEAMSMQTEGSDVGLCPVMRNPASSEYSYTYEGKTYYFCCPMCIEQFKKDPQKYISRIKEFNVEAYQFGFDPAQITVHKGDIVRILVTSRDVPHGFFIKEYNINVPVKKGEVKRIEFLADKAGTFDIRCSVYCGPGHQDMRAKLVVE